MITKFKMLISSDSLVPSGMVIVMNETADIHLLKKRKLCMCVSVLSMGVMAN